MKKEMEDFFNCKVRVERKKIEIGLPVFMTMREITRVELWGCKFAVVDLSGERQMTVSAMKKQAVQYERALRMPVAYQLNVDSAILRNALVKNGVPFISLPGNIYLPFLGIVLQEVYHKNSVKTDKMMPVTQMVFLKLLYYDEKAGILKSEVAKKLNLTKTSITRATAQLEGMGLISQQKSGTEIRIKRNASPREYFEKAKEHLINPVQKVIEVRNEGDVKGLFLAGESALSMASSLNPPAIKEMAVYKGSDFAEKFTVTDSRIDERDKCMKVQLWKYDPSIFAKDGKVDMVSLACSFLGMEDERVEMCIEEMMEEL